MNKEYMCIGYIRSPCLSKVAHLFEGKPITQFCITRSEQDVKKLDGDSPTWEDYKIRALVGYGINWNAWKGHSSWPQVLNRLNTIKTKHHFKDFIVNKIECGMQDKTLIKYMNEIIEKKLISAGIGNKFKAFPENTWVYPTFKNYPLARTTINGWKADIIRDINLNSIVNMGFKKSVLDIIHIETDQKKKYNKIEDLSFLIHNEKIVECILKNLDKTKWFELPGVLDTIDKNTGDHPYPGAIRTYEKGSGITWKFLNDREVR